MDRGACTDPNPSSGGKPAREKGKYELSGVKRLKKTTWREAGVPLWSGESGVALVERQDKLDIFMCYGPGL